MAAHRKEIWATITLQPVEYNLLDDGVQEVVTIDSKIEKILGRKYYKQYDNIFHYKGTLINGIAPALYNLLPEIEFVSPKMLFIMAKGNGLKVLVNNSLLFHIANGGFVYTQELNVDYGDITIDTDSTDAEVEILVGA